MEPSISRILTDLITEAHNIAISDLQESCNEYKCAVDRLEVLEDSIKAVLTDEQQLWLQRYKLLSKSKAHYEQRYMYIQGLKDYAEMKHYVNNDCLDRYLLTAEVEVE